MLFSRHLEIKIENLVASIGIFFSQTQRKLGFLSGNKDTFSNPIIAFL